MTTLIQAELEKRDRSVHYMHKKLGGNRTRVYDAARGYGRATLPLRQKIADFRGVPMDAVFSEDGFAQKTVSPAKGGD